MSLSKAFVGPVGLTFIAMVITAVAILRPSSRSSQPFIHRRNIPSPRKTLLPRLSAQQAAALAYPLNLLPGARDVATPYGVYEWGPEDGKKVLMIHGDTTLAPLYEAVAQGLVKRHRRVMIIGMSSP